MSLTWRVRPALPVTKLLGAVAALALVALVGRTDPVQWAVAGTTALALIGWAVRDVVVPVRLAADPQGITVVTGFARRQRLSWTQIERVRVDRRSRRGLRSELLEVDAGEALFLLSGSELGAPPEEVAQALETLRSGGPHGQSSAAVW